MTWTYNKESITTNLAKVRLRIGDTDINDPLLSDEEINYFLSLKADPTLAAIDCCKTILGKWSREPDRSNLGFSASRSQRISNLETVIKQLEQEAYGLAEVFAGGVSQDDKDTINSNSDFVPHLFYRGADDNNQ